MSSVHSLFADLYMLSHTFQKVALLFENTAFFTESYFRRFYFR